VVRDSFIELQAADPAKKLAEPASIVRKLCWVFLFRSSDVLLIKILHIQILGSILGRDQLISMYLSTLPSRSIILAFITSIASHPAPVFFRQALRFHQTLKSEKPSTSKQLKTATTCLSPLITVRKMRPIALGLSFRPRGALESICSIFSRLSPPGRVLSVPMIMVCTNTHEKKN
jgi:hypothetical protein